MQTIIYRMDIQQGPTITVIILEVHSAPLDCYWEYGLLFSRLPLYWREKMDQGQVKHDGAHLSYGDSTTSLD